QLGIFFENRDDVLTEKLADQQQPHHGPIFIAIADQKRPIVLQVGKRRNQLGFRSALETEVKRSAGLQNFLHHFVKLIHFDRVYADVLVSVFGFLDCPAERGVQLDDARPQKILKPDQKRKLNSLLLEVLNHAEDINGDGITKNRPHGEVAF